MKKKKARKKIIQLLNQCFSIMSKIELGDDVIFEIHLVNNKKINNRKVRPLTEGKEKLNFKKNPPSNKKTPPPPKMSYGSYWAEN
jgi:hypothetical protein